MSSTFDIRNRTPALILAAVIATAIVGFAAIPAAASGDAQSVAGDNYRPSEWTEVGSYGATRETPSLTGSAGEPEGGTGSQLLVGIGLVAAGVAVLIVAALAGGGTRRPGGGGRPNSRVGGWRPATHPPAKTPTAP